MLGAWSLGRCPLGLGPHKPRRPPLAAMSSYRCSGWGWGAQPDRAEARVTVGQTFPGAGREWGTALRHRSSWPRQPGQRCQATPRTPAERTHASSTIPPRQKPPGLTPPSAASQPPTQPGPLCGQGLTDPADGPTALPTLVWSPRTHTDMPVHPDTDTQTQTHPCFLARR